MRVQELYEQVAGLGFEKSLEDEDWFYQAANRALLQVNYLRPAISSYVINHKPMKNLIDGSFTPVERSEDLIYEATNAKAYYFQADGIGRVIIQKQNSVGGWSQIGEVGLNGELRNVSQLGKRLSEAAKMGFKTAVAPTRALKNVTIPKQIKAVGITNLYEAIKILKSGE